MKKTLNIKCPITHTYIIHGIIPDYLYIVCKIKWVQINMLGKIRSAPITVF